MSSLLRFLSMSFASKVVIPSRAINWWRAVCVRVWCVVCVLCVRACINEWCVRALGVELWPSPVTQATRRVLRMHVAFARVGLTWGYKVGMSVKSKQL